MSALRIIFMGSPDFSVPILRALIEAGHEIVCVYAQPPRPAGRGHKERPCPVHAFARDRNLPVRTPRTLKDDSAQAEFAALAADIAVVAAYGLILPQAVLDAPRFGCVNVHASLLPRWRGAAPIQRAILAGDAESGVTVMQMDAGLDTGAMLMQGTVPIEADTTAQVLHDRLAGLGAALIVRALEGIAAGMLTPTPQPEDGVTYAAKIERGEGRLDWTQSAGALERHVRAFTPWPGAWFEYGGERIKVLQVRAIEGNEGGAPGTVLDERLTVACGDGAVRLERLQRAGRSALDAATFLRGFALPSGTRLG
ncbi:MAG: methionyl-tRNA formyltransferase [Rhodospirillales bacterium]